MLRLRDGDEQSVYKVLGSWAGGFLHGDSWRLNSGVVAVGRDRDHWIFRGSSGSIYRCHKDAYGMTAYTASVLAAWQKGAPLIEVMPEKTAWEYLL
jgi:hypothetical protein